MRSKTSWLDLLRILKEEIKEMFLPAGHKLSKMGKGVTKHTTKFKTSFSARLLISDKEQEIENQYKELGRKFYTEQWDHPPVEYRELMENIRSLHQEISQAKEHLKFIQGIRLCPDCQSENPIDAAFCAYCGHSLPPLEAEAPALPQEPRVCPHCGEEMADHAVFCIKCGFRLGEPPAEMDLKPDPPTGISLEKPESPTPTPEDPQSENDSPAGPESPLP